MGKRKEIKSKGKVISVIEENDSGKWEQVTEDNTPVEERIIALNEKTDEINVDVKVGDVLRVLEMARYFTSASMREYQKSNGNDNVCQYDNTINKLYLSDCDVVIAGTGIEVGDGELSFSFDLEDCDSFEIYGGGNLFVGVDDKGNNLTRMNFHATIEENDNGNRQTYDMYFVYPISKG